MEWRTWSRAALAGATLSLTSAIPAGAQAPARALAPAAAPTAAPASIARAAPAGAPQARAVVDLASALAQTAAVVEGTVRELRAEYNDAEGPWTRIVLGDVQVHLGALPKAEVGEVGAAGSPARLAKSLELWQFGGSLPNGRLVVAAELPVLTKGKRYLLFLRNTEWNVSPIVGPWALRVEPLGRGEALVTGDGQAVLGVGEAGLALGAALFEPVPLDGSPARPLAAAAAAQAAALPDRAALLRALEAAMAAQQLQASGTFLARPAGRFRWRGQAVAPHGQVNSSAAAGRDISGGPR